MNSSSQLEKSLVQKRAPGEQRDDVDAPRFDGLAAAFLTIDEDEGEGDFSTFALDGIDGFQGGAAGGDDVIDDDHSVAGFEIAFDLFAGTMAFGLLADGENLKRFGRIFHRGGHPDGQGNRIGAEGHAADGVDFELLGVDFRTDGMPAEVADEQGSEGIERGDAAVDVEVAFFSRCEGEGAGTDGFLKQELFEGRSGVEHGRDDGMKAEILKSGKTETVICVLVSGVGAGVVCSR